MMIAIAEDIMKERMLFLIVNDGHESKEGHGYER
jgi:hypothetical protein